MFDFEGLAGLDDAGLAAAAVACHRGLVEHECGYLQVAAQWADRFPPERDGRAAGPGRPVGQLLGGEGTPPVAEFAAAELGPLLATTTGSARHLIADALDLRHRLPRLWARVLAGQVRAGKARKVAEATRHLGREAAGAVDAAVAGAVTALPWARFGTLLEAKIVEVDPAGAEARARLADAERFVRAGRTSEAGLKLLVARAAAGDVIWFLAMVGRIADILAAEGDPDPVDVRRSKAIGVLAQPAEALRLLLAHRADPPHPADPTEPDEADPTEPEEDHPAEPEQAHPADADPAGPPGAGSGAAFGLRRSVRLPPLPVDPERCRPRATVYVHLSEEALAGGQGVARVEDVGPVLLTRIRRLLGDRCAVTVTPVIDLPAGMAPVDGYEVPARMRE
ncbi:MAG: hypothetical protein ACLGIF_10265, partial [Actinomycetes bacterium]